MDPNSEQNSEQAGHSRTEVAFRCSLMSSAFPPPPQDHLHEDVKSDGQARKCVNEFDE